MGKLKKFLRKKQQNNKASKSRKKRQRNNRKKAAANPKKWDAFINSENVCKLPPPEPVSKDYFDALSVQYMAALGVTFTNSHYQPVLNSDADPKWDALMKSKEDYKLPPPEPVSKDYFDALSVQYMAALGVTYTNSHYQPPYTVTPVLNSGADPENWDAFMKSKKDYELPPPEPVSKDYFDALSLETMAA